MTDKRLVTDAEVAELRKHPPVTLLALDACLDTIDALKEALATVREHNEYHRNSRGGQWDDHCIREAAAVLTHLRGEEP